MVLKYLVLSDLHLGEEDSLLTNLKPGLWEQDPLKASPVLTSFTLCLEELLKGQENRPWLVILGDGLELALARFNQAAMVFERLVEEWLVKRALFSGLIYIPGNHDHHLWETSREIQYANYVARRKPPGSFLPPPWHISEVFPKKSHHFVPSPFIGRFLRRFPQLEDFPVGITYPVLGLINEEKKRIVCLHHGHLLEGIYRLMSKLRVTLFPGEQEPQTLNEIEEENFAWIDFFWSTMGRSGKVGERIETIYESLLVPETFKDLLANLAKALAQKFDIPLVPERWEDDLIQKVLEKTFRKALYPERKKEATALSEEVERELNWFVEGPLLKEIEKVNPEGNLSDYAFDFVFGHTHKPFARLDRFAPFSPWARVFNTGGWVIDRLELFPVYGANLVLITDELEVLCLELFRLGETAFPRPALVKGTGEDLLKFIKPILEKPVWERFATEVQIAAQIRASHLRKRVLERAGFRH